MLTVLTTVIFVIIGVPAFFALLGMVVGLIEVINTTAKHYKHESTFQVLPADKTVAISVSYEAYLKQRDVSQFGPK